MRNAKKSEFKLTKIALAVSAALCFTQPAFAVPANATLPKIDKVVIGNGNVTIGADSVNNVMNIKQDVKTSVIKWKDFSVGADATVNFVGENGKDFTDYNSVNFVNSGKVSEIYGQVNAQGGNIVIANSAGVQIGSSAQINVGSIYVTNKELSDEFVKANINVDSTIADIKNTINKAQNSAAELMSMGGIVSAGEVTFDGDRIVIDTDHLYANTKGDKLKKEENLIITSSEDNNVVLGYKAYNKNKGGYDKIQNADASKTIIVKDKEGNKKEYSGYMWVEDLEQLQAINSNLDGNYALRNSIDANYTSKDSFEPIGNNDAFKGKFDGLGYNIFDLNITKDNQNYIGLFGRVENATIRNFTLNAGTINGQDFTGAVAGYAINSNISNIVNTINVIGNNNTGGIVGGATNSNLADLINIGTINSTGKENLGGIVGIIDKSEISGESYNLGAVIGEHTYNVGGIVGCAKNSSIGNKLENSTSAFQIYNKLNITGSYNVGGIAGNANNTQINNVANFGSVFAKGSYKEPYSYHTANTNAYGYNSVSKTGNVNVLVANVGGIVGTSSNNTIISDVKNSGDVLTAKTDGTGITGTYYNAGNVGGIVGRAEDTTISNAENKENDVAGSHNIGGVVGYLTGESSVSIGINNGGDITATGARNEDNTRFVQENVRNNGQEIFNIGNIGGIVGYMQGDNAFVSDSANRGTVHSERITTDVVYDTSKAANVGGIVGKVDRSKTHSLEEIKNNETLSAISNSYNAGTVFGYTGVGGVVGFMYNGEVTSSYNTGTVASSRISNTVDDGAIDPLNMGGVVGDTTEGTNASSLIYNVYNSGTIGDNTFNYSGRHVGGIVGRLSGIIEKAYNTGDIYNGYNVVGGIAGYWTKGSINNTFNTGNITVSNKNDAQSQVGGIVGAVDLSFQNLTVSNSYNLGTLRSFKSGKGDNVLGGVVGFVVNWDNDDIKDNYNRLTIKNVYTLGNLYVDSGTAGAIIGSKSDNVPLSPVVQNAFYIKPERANIFSQITNFANGVKVIEYAKRFDMASYEGLDFRNYGSDGKVTSGSDYSEDSSWRIYEGLTTPILNAFLPAAEEYFSKNNVTNVVDSIQYGTAANPLFTIINAKKELDSNLTFSWKDLGITGSAGLAVYGAGLTLTDFGTKDAGRYYGGTIYADGILTLQGNDNSIFNFGSGAKLYGSSVKIEADKSDVTIIGNVTSTNGTIDISGADVEILGRLESLDESESVAINGISNTFTESLDYSNVNNKDLAVSRIDEAYAHKVNSGSANNRNITINASGTADVLYGHLHTGSVSLGENSSLEITGNNGVYIDTDVSGVDGNIVLNSGNGEVLLDLTNFVKANMSDSNLFALYTQNLLSFLDNHNKDSDKSILLNSGIGDNKLTVDMWNEDNNSFDLTLYDDPNNGGKFTDRLDALNIVTSEQQTLSSKDIVHIWVSNAEQFEGIQRYSDNNRGFLGFNFALKNDIDASEITDYQAIGGDSEFTGKFDGRNNRIIGLNVGNDDSTKNGTNNAGIFSSIGEKGVVSNLRVYASNFYGNDYSGTIAGINKGTISGITTLGNHIEVFGSENSEEINGQRVGLAGGIAGLNTGKGVIKQISVSDSVVAGDSGISSIVTTAGGVVGFNDKEATVGATLDAEGEILDSSDHVLANSAVTANEDSTLSLGGIAGVNHGQMILVTNTGITHGEYGGSITANNVGGIVGINDGSVVSAYNSSDISGGNSVGGIAGNNSGTIVNAINAGDILVDVEGTKEYEYSGGLVGYNDGRIDSGRNTGEIYGSNYVGGMVGYNGTDADLKNLSNSVFAYIYGNNYVGGIAGKNQGQISAESQLINDGKIFGLTYVGGIAGENSGLIENTISNISLNIRENINKNAEYFGGVVGLNSGIIDGATNSNEVSASDAIYVGGIIGKNTDKGVLKGDIKNGGTVLGKENVGGIIGINENQTLLDNTNNAERLTISNTGKVIGGGAAGIFYSNSSKISNTELVNEGEIVDTAQTSTGNKAYGGLFGINIGDIENSILINKGKVSGNDIVGGLIGENQGKITNSILKNSGSVTGTGAENINATGGLIGRNVGKIEFSSLINTVDSAVLGGSNVGGLIGYNTGTITGGRTDDGNKDLGFYKYQIYNNGSVTATGNNVGGLIGYNAANVTAAYNTGVVSSEGNNVGGIAGTNTAQIDQVFNTILTANGSEGSIRGKDNVGGIIGLNEGTLSNAYSTSKVEGFQSGLIVGPNSGSGRVENVYSSEGKDGQFNNDGIWKTYEGKDPILKVFLTQLTVDKDNLNAYLEDNALIYNGKEQDLDIDALIAAGVISGPAGMTDDELKSLFNAYNNTKDVDGNSALLANTAGQIDADSYSNWITSAQIIASSSDNVFNPNNLGYNIELSTDVKKRTITLADLEAFIKYGNQDNKGLQIENVDLNDYLVNVVDGDSISITGDAKFDYIVGSSYADDKGDRITADVGSYQNSLKIEGLTLIDDSGNYELDLSGSVGDITVTQADLSIVVDDASTSVGFLPEFAGTNISNSLVNGDSLEHHSYSYGIGNESLINNEGSYSNVIGIFVDGIFYGAADQVNWSDVDSVFKNYNVSYSLGTLTVSKASEPKPEPTPSPALPEINLRSPYGHVYQEGWGWKRNFRERKAEVHFEDGGVKTPQSL